MGIHIGHVELIKIAPQLLGAVHGHLGGLDQTFAVIAVIGEMADADTGRRVKLQIIQHQLPGQTELDLLDDFRNLLEIGYILKKQNELVAAETGQGIRPPHMGFEPQCHLA